MADTETLSAKEADNGTRTEREIPADAIAIVPVRQLVMFPGMVIPVTLGRPRSVAAAQDAVRSERQIGILAQREAGVDDPGELDLYRIGTVANVVRYLTGKDGTHHVVSQGEQRFRVVEFLHGWPFLVARIERIATPDADPTQVQARFINLKRQAIEALELLPQVPQEMVQQINGITDPGILADIVSAYLDLTVEEKQEVLETIDLVARLDRVSSFLAGRIEVLRLSQEIGQQTRASLDKRQREVLLREQMAAIQKELGENEGKENEIAELSEAITKAEMPKEVEDQARRELRRLERMPEAAAEYGMIRTYLDWLIELPWKLAPEAPIDLKEARAILDEDHFGLDKIKRRIVEYLAVRKLAPEGKAPILCFVGPPGVGKTSLGQSIARAMGRKFVRVSLGGVHDEAEIRGHRRTYVGALPGNIIQGIRRAGARNCVMMLDEIDKLGRGIQGDPSAAMLEVLDPEQNSTFRDNYLAVPFDLSRVVFIATANVLDTIPGPLRDRMEIISLSGYTDGEKLEIAKRYLIRRQFEANGLKPDQADITDAALREIVDHYTRESGVRNLEREIGRALRYAAVEIAEGRTERVELDVGDLLRVLGPPRFENEVAMRTSVPGVATGLAWTPVGGDILFIEATRTPGSGRLILTGQLGDVMKESAQAALSLVKSRYESLGIDPERFEKSDIHIHVPDGATPKDGPSAGIAMTTALVSALTGIPVRADVAMTGEITLRGEVTAIGGLKEKLLAALRGGIRTVLIPEENAKDLQEIPENVKNGLEIVPVRWIDKVLEVALERHPTPLSDDEATAAATPLPAAAAPGEPAPVVGTGSVKH